MSGFEYWPFATAGVAAITWAIHVTRHDAITEIFVWLIGSGLMFAGAYGIFLYRTNITIIHEVGSNLNIRKIITIDTRDSTAFQVIDGDTVKFLGKLLRLKDIDSFEKDQCCRDSKGALVNCGRHAMDHLQSLIDRQMLTCSWTDTDGRNRPLATCFIGEKNLNASMVSSGQAIVFMERKNRSSQWEAHTTYSELQESAKKRRIGLHQYTDWEKPHERRANMRAGIAPRITGCK